MGRFTIILIAILLICGAGKVPTGNLSQGLVCSLPLDEGAGLRAHEATGMIVGGYSPCPITTLTWGVNSSLGKSLIWAAPNTNKVTIGKPSPLNLTTSEMTVSAWVVLTSLSGGVNSGYRYICSDYNTGASNAQFALQVNNGQRAVFFWANSGTQSPAPLSAQGSSTIVINKLYHFVGVRSGVTGAWRADIYVNGRVDGGTTTSGNPCAQSSAGNIQVGQAGDYTGALGMVGSIKKLDIWKRALKPNEIKELYIEGLKNITK